MVNRYIITNRNDGLDPDKLVEYNPKLSLVSPAARVAYAKFKMNKIKQEYDESVEGRGSTSDSVKASVENELDGSCSTTQGPDSVFEAPSVKDVAKAKPSLMAAMSIERPRPRGSIRAPAPPTTDAVHSVTTAEVQQSAPPRGPPPIPPPKPMEVREFRPKTPIPEEDEMQTPSASPLPPNITIDDTHSKSSSEGSSPKGGKPEPETPPVEEAEAAKRLKAETSKEAPPTPTPRKSPAKPGGKSKLTGQTVTGWL